MYKAKKPCRFGGRSYFVGDPVPAEAIDPKRAAALLKYGLIEARVDEPEQKPVDRSKGGERAVATPQKRAGKGGKSA